MLGRIGVYERVEAALERAVQFVLEHRLSDGRLVGGCAGRALESALVLQLLRRLELAPGLQARIAEFCRRYLAESTGEVSRAALLDRRLSRVICELVLTGRLGEEGLVALDRALVEFDHPTLWRKRVFVEVILAELGGLPPAAMPLPLAVVRAGASQLWVTILLASIRVLQMCQLGRGHEVSDAEIASIVGTQSTDGSWEQHVLVTCVALMALARLGRASPSVARGVEFVGQFAVIQGAIAFLRDFFPGACVNFVYRPGLRFEGAFFSGFYPFFVFPGVLIRPDDGGCSRWGFPFSSIRIAFVEVYTRIGMDMIFVNGAFP